MMGTTICACQLAASGVHHTTAGRPFSDRRAAAQSNAKRVRRSSVQRAGVCMRRQRSQALDSSKTSETGWRTAPRHHPSRHTTGETRLARRGGEAAEVPWPGQAARLRREHFFAFPQTKVSHVRSRRPLCAHLTSPRASPPVVTHSSANPAWVASREPLQRFPQALEQSQSAALLPATRSGLHSVAAAVAVARRGTARHVLLCVLAGAWSTLRPPLPHGWCRPSSSHRARPFRQPLGVDGSRAARRVLMCFPVLGAWCTPRPTPPPHRAPLDRARATQLRTFGSYPASASSAAARAAACAGRAEGGRVRPAGGGSATQTTHLRACRGRALARARARARRARSVRPRGPRRG